MSPSSSREILRIRRLIGLFLFCASTLMAEPLASPSWGFSFDPPAGFSLTDGDGKDRFAFVDSVSSVELALRAYPSGTYGSCEEAMKTAMGRLSAQWDSASFNYGRRRVVIAKLEFDSLGYEASGWAICGELDTAEGQAQRGTAAAPAFLLAIAYGEKGKTENAGPVIPSVLDSLRFGPVDSMLPGPITFFTYPQEGEKTVNVTIEGVKEATTIDKADAEASAYVVEREYAVLTAYQNSPLWLDAWTRFYRETWRDSWARLDGFAFAAERAARTAIMLRPDADGGPTSAAQDDPDRALAATLLHWVQGFHYERNLEGSDFVDLVSSATEERGDCDSRSMLLALLLRKANVNAILMVSPEYSHAMTGIDVGGGGARFDFQDSKWLVAETTDDVAIGLIGQTVSDPTKWIGIQLP